MRQWLDVFGICMTVTAETVHTLFLKTRHKLTFQRRFFAILMAVTVLMLALLSASPAAHRWLHADSDHDDHECAITLYAQGVTAALVGVVLLLVARCPQELVRSVEELLIVQTHYLHVPGRAPPRC